MSKTWMHIAIMATNNLRIISWNVNGLRARCGDVHYYVHRNHIDVVLLQETGDKNGCLLTLKGYKKYQLLAGAGTRGLATYVRDSIPSELIEEPQKNEGVESICVSLHLKEGLLNIVNLYISKNCFTVNALPDNIFGSMSFVAGDLNARHRELESSGKMNTNGARFYQFLRDYPDTSLLGSKDATHIQGGRLDYAFLLNGQGLEGHCEVVPDLLSDHFSLDITLPLGKNSVQYNTRKRIVLCKEKRELFITNIQRWYKNYTAENIDKFYGDLVKIIEELLYSGKSKSDKNSNKLNSTTNRYYNDKTLKEWSLMMRRAHRKWRETGGDDSDKSALCEAAKLCGELRREIRTKYWENFTNRIGNCKNTSDIWREVNKATGKRKRSVAHPQPGKVASELIGRWTHAASSSSLPRDITDSIKGWESDRREFILSALNTGDVSDVAITKDELLHAIKTGKSTAPGEDGITYDVLNCLASMEDSPLLHLYNLSFREGKLPREWKKAIIIPVPKPNGEHRPISLTSCCSKMMERIILNRLLYLIGDQFSSNLYGFQKGKGTSNAVIKCISNDIDYCRVFIDLKSAFDKANGEVILYELAGLGVKGRMLHWIGDYLFGRRAQVCFQGFLSEEKCFELGTPQGGVLSPTLFNVLMNKIASAKLCEGVNSIIYADDILLQGNTIENMQNALDNFSKLTQSLGLLINESKTKFQCRATSNKKLMINGKYIERVRSYKYLGMYVGYTADSREAQLNHLQTQCKARIQPLRSLAWRGKGAGVPVLRLMYITTIRSLIEYASPVLSCFDDGRLEKIEKLQNEAMRIVLNCPRNAMIDVMRLELSLGSIKNKVTETNVIAALRHMRSGAGKKLASDLHAAITETRLHRWQGKRGYIRGLASTISKYTLQDHCMEVNPPNRLPPWEEESASVSILPLKKKKCMYNTMELRDEIESKLMALHDKNTAQVYCDGAVMENGRAGCGVLVRSLEGNTIAETEHSFRISDNVSSTQAELCAILHGLRELKTREGNASFFVDSRSALESLTSRHPVHGDTAMMCKAALQDLREKNRKITFYWIPSHIGLPQNERADRLAKAGTKQNTVTLTCTSSLKQVKTQIRRSQDKENTLNMARKHTNSTTFQHYVKVLQMTDFTYGRMKNAWGDALCTRLRLGCKYLWQLGVERAGQDVSCRLCQEPRSHTLHHYVIQCPVLDTFRNHDIVDVTDQIIWMFNNNKIEEIINKCKNIRNLIYE